MKMQHMFYSNYNHVISNSFIVDWMQFPQQSGIYFLIGSGNDSTQNTMANITNSFHFEVSC